MRNIATGHIFLTSFPYLLSVEPGVLPAQPRALPLLTPAAQRSRLEASLSSSTRRVAPMEPRESTEVRGAGTGQGRAREQHRQHSGEQNLSGAFFHAPHYTKYANQVTSE